MSVYLHSIETAVPQYRHDQAGIIERFQTHSPDKRSRRLTTAAIKASGIETKYSVCHDMVNCPPYDSEGKATTSARNAVYAVESRKLATELGKRLIENTDGIDRSDITHVIYASCTGFVNPGPDYFLVKDLGLPEGVERTVVGFMGCYAAFPAMRIARQICMAEPDATVMVMCLELSTLHLQLEGGMDTILGNAVFADGAAACIVRAKPPANPKGCLVLDKFVTATIPDSEDSMAWSIGDMGFDLVLSSYVPKVIEQELSDVLSRVGLDPAQVDEWAVHPGGKMILDKVESSLSLGNNALEASRKVLREYGNMSSATILFVLKEMGTMIQPGSRIGAIAFGPGLTVETAQFRAAS